MLPHRIRLRGPWQVTVSNDARTLRLPEQWDEIGGAAAMLERHFGWPAPLAAHERVWLVIEGLTSPATLWVNGQQLEMIGPNSETEVTAFLQKRNQLLVELPGGGRWDEAVLEVRATAWLSSLTATRVDDRLVLRGKLHGTADGPLDLYAILGRHNVLHASVEPRETTFEFGSDPIPADRWQPEVRVELIRGSAVWHAANLPITLR